MVAAERDTTAVAGAGGLLFFGPLLMILFRQKYPRWWFDWNLELQRFTNRVAAYLALMDDRYPSTTDQQSVHLDYDYPDAARDLNRWLPLVKWFLPDRPLASRGCASDRPRSRFGHRLRRQDRDGGNCNEEGNFVTAIDFVASHR